LIPDYQCGFSSILVKRRHFKGLLPVPGIGAKKITSVVTDIGYKGSKPCIKTRPYLPAGNPVLRIRIRMDPHRFWFPCLMRIRIQEGKEDPQKKKGGIGINVLQFDKKYRNLFPDCKFFLAIKSLDMRIHNDLFNSFTPERDFKSCEYLH